jgi:homoserine O-acetyltransferase
MKVERDAVSVGAFEFECGESIPDLELAYEAYGEFDGSNTVLVCHALTGSAHVTGGGDREDTGGQARAWWKTVVGPGKAIDTNDYHVVCVNVPGSCYGSTGPASENPETGEPYGTDFPTVTVTDWTHAQRRLLDEIGVGRLHAVVGGSVGGMNVLEWAKQYPDDVRRVIPIAAAARLDTQCLALDAIAARAITSDPNWRGGDYYGETHPDDGLARARQIGHVMYLSKSSMAAKFGRRAAGRDSHRESAPGGLGDFGSGYVPYREVESYLDYNGEAFVERFDANAYLYLLRAMDNYDLAARYEGDADALAAFEGEALVVSFIGDWYFTVEQSEALTEAFREAGADTAHHVVDSDYGHDAFLVESDLVGPPLSDFLAEGTAGRSVTDTAESEDGDDFAPVHTSLFAK